MVPGSCPFFRQRAQRFDMQKFLDAGSRPLHLAVEGGHIDTIKLFTEEFASLIPDTSVNARDEYSNDLLHVACKASFLDRLAQASQYFHRVPLPDLPASAAESTDSNKRGGRTASTADADGYHTMNLFNELPRDRNGVTITKHASNDDVEAEKRERVRQAWLKR